MTQDPRKYTLDRVEALELAPGTARANLEGWIPTLAGEEDLRLALEKAFDYRGDVTLTLKSGERVEAYVFNRKTAATLAESTIQYYTPAAPEKRSLSYAEIARLEFSGKEGRGKAVGGVGEEIQRTQGRGRDEHRPGAGGPGLTGRS